MERIDRLVKSTRPYNSTRRQLQAEQTRSLVLETARRMFLTDGFALTTIAAVASEASVSVETIYKAFAGKAGLVRAICEQALAGEGPAPAEVRSDSLQATEPDARKIIRGWGRLTSEVAPRVSPILLLLRSAAASEPEMATLQTEMDAQRLRRMTRNAQTLADGGHLWEGVTVAYAADVLWTYSSPELYGMLVVARGWSLDRYGEFVAAAMIAALLPPAG